MKSLRSNDTLRRHARVGLHARIRSDLVELLRADAKRRGVTIGRIIDQMLSERFLDRRESSQKQLIKKLEELRAEMTLSKRQIETIRAAVELYIRVWFANTEEIPEALKSQFAERGSRRFERFREELKGRM